MLRKLGKFDLLRRLGSGATAEVFLASGPTPRGEDLLALKVVLAHLAEDASQRQMIQQEARTSSHLHHENIVEVYEVGEVDGRPYLSMELVRGWSLRALEKKLAAQSERLAVEEACAIVHQAAMGLHYAHEATDANGRPLGLIHRDVSPHNLIVGEDGVVKLVDFGLAKATLSQATQTGGIKGKLPYMPPEQLKGAEDLDRKVDVFALGAILFELLSGEMLYPGKTEAEVFQQALYEPQRKLRDLEPELPEGLCQLVQRAIEREPARRYATARAIAKALEPFVTQGARQAIAARVASCFPPLPRTASEAVGLPETPTEARRKAARSPPPSKKKAAASPAAVKETRAPRKAPPEKREPSPSRRAEARSRAEPRDQEKAERDTDPQSIFPTDSPPDEDSEDTNQEDSDPTALAAVLARRKRFGVFAALLASAGFGVLALLAQ